MFNDHFHESGQETAARRTESWKRRRNRSAAWRRPRPEIGNPPPAA